MYSDLGLSREFIPYFILFINSVRLPFQHPTFTLSNSNSNFKKIGKYFKFLFHPQRRFLMLIFTPKMALPPSTGGYPEQKARSHLPLKYSHIHFLLHICAKKFDCHVEAQQILFQDIYTGFMAYYSYLQFNTVYCTWHKTAMTVLKAFKKKVLFPIHRKFTVNEVSNENTAKKKNSRYSTKCFNNILWLKPAFTISYNDPKPGYVSLLTLVIKIQYKD